MTEIGDYVGRYVAVMYTHPEVRVWHELYLYRTPRVLGHYCVITLDFEAYVEQISVSNPGIHDSELLASGGASVRRARPHDSFLRFLGPVSADSRFDQACVEGDLAVHTSALPGLPRRPSQPVGPPATCSPRFGSVTIDSDSVWLVAEHEADGVVFGQEVHPNVGAIQGGVCRAMMLHAGDMLSMQKVKRCDAEAYRARDSRVLPLKYDGTGRRRRLWASVVEETSTDAAVEGVDLARFSVSGDASQETLERVGSPSGYLDW